MPIDPQRLAQIMQRMKLAQPGGAPMPAPSGAPMDGPPMGGPMGGPPPGVPMQINGVMTPQPQGGPPMGGPGGPQGMPMRPMMPPGGMPPR